MNADRRAEILLVRDACVVFDEAEVPARIVARLLSELVAWSDRLTREDEDFAKLEAKCDDLRERLDQEARNANLMASKLLEAEGKLATETEVARSLAGKLEAAERDRNILAAMRAEDIASAALALVGKAPAPERGKGGELG